MHWTHFMGGTLHIEYREELWNADNVFIFVLIYMS